MVQELVLLCCDGACPLCKTCERYTFDPTEKIMRGVKIRTEITLRDYQERDCAYYQPTGLGVK